VVVRSEEEVPCDMIMLRSAHPEGNCFVETSNLVFIVAYLYVMYTENSDLYVMYFIETWNFVSIV